MSDYNVDASNRFPIKAWTKGVQVEDVAVEQLRNIADLPFIHKHVTGSALDRGNIGTMSEFVNKGLALGPRAPVVRGRQQAVDLKRWRLQSTQP